MPGPIKPLPAVRVAAEESTKPKGDTSPLDQLVDPVPTLNPKEPPMPSKRDQPAIPLADDPHFQMQTIVNDIHRGIHPDVESLPADKKAQLLAAMDAESEAERVYRDPSRELTRERMRELLGAKRRDGRTERPPQKPKP